MLDLQWAFENFSPDIDASEPSVDCDFITDFLQPYFQHMEREQLVAALAEVIAIEEFRHQPASRPSAH